LNGAAAKRRGDGDVKTQSKKARKDRGTKSKGGRRVNGKSKKEYSEGSENIPIGLGEKKFWG